MLYVTDFTSGNECLLEESRSRKLSRRYKLKNKFLSQKPVLLQFRSICPVAVADNTVLIS